MRRSILLMPGALAVAALSVAAVGYTDRYRVAAPTPGLANATILIIRHAEKPANGVGLTASGEARARAYVPYFKKLRIDGRPAAVTDLVAAADSPNSMRPRLTLTPLSLATALPIVSGFKSWDVDGLAGWLHQHAANRTILIAWHHGEIPRLMAALGARPAAILPFGRWPGGSYDQMVVIHYDEQGRPEPSQSSLVREDISI